MILEKRRRDEMMERLVQQLTPTSVVTSEAKQSKLSITPKLLRNIKSFTGKSAGVGEWIKSLENIQELHRLPDHYILETARSKLTEGAKTCFETNRMRLNTWEAFTTAFRTIFTREESLTEKWKNMIERVQRKGEPIEQYFHEKVQPYANLNLAFEESKKQILIGL